MKLIVGLGNPGKRYEKTRHNIGFLVLDRLRERLGETCTIDTWELSKKFNAQICGCQYKNEKIILAKPMTFMNASGEAVGLIAHFYKLAARDIIVVHDDKDIPLGRIQEHTDRGHAGHNGVKSITEHIGTQAYTRFRIGIAAANEKKMKDASAFVLSKFGILERKEVKRVLEESTAMILNQMVE